MAAGDAVPARIPRSGNGVPVEGVLALDGGQGRTRLYTPHRGAHGDPQIPTIRADSRGERLVVSADGPIRVTDIEGGVADALASFGEEWARRCGVRAITAAPSVWCSWYHYYLEATPADIEENLVAMDRLCLPGRRRADR